MIIIHAKPGTLSGIYLRVKGLRRPPRIGEPFFAKSVHPVTKKSPPAEKWERWICDEIRGDLYMLLRS